MPYSEQQHEAKIMDRILFLLKFGSCYDTHLYKPVQKAHCTNVLYSNTVPHTDCLNDLPRSPNTSDNG